MKKILIVEDDESILELLSTVFSFFDEFQLTLSKDGGEALEMARHSVPDLIILDLQIPTVDGIGVCQRIRSGADTAATKILVLTGMAQDSDRLQAEEAGADRFITKPFRMSTIVDTVNELLA